MSEVFYDSQPLSRMSTEEILEEVRRLRLRRQEAKSTTAQAKREQKKEEKVEAQKQLKSLMEASVMDILGLKS